MTVNRSIQMNIAAILRAMDTPKTFAKANELEMESSTLSSLHLRDLGLDTAQLIAIVECFKQDEGFNTDTLRSISLSYNTMIGDKGLRALMAHLPETITEIGLVDCGLSDEGGLVLLEWISRLPQLRMICIEQNNFSESIKSQISKFRDTNQNILLVY